MYSLAGGVRTVSPHVHQALHITHTADRRTFATYGYSDVIEIWSAPESSRKRAVTTGHGAVSQVEFIDDTGQFISAGRDGRLLLWSPEGEAKELARLDQPIEAFALGPTLHSATMISADGRL